MLKAILQSVAIVVTIGLTYVGVKFLMKKLGLTPLEVGQISVEQQATIDTLAKTAGLRALPALRDAQEADATDRKERKEKIEKLAKELAAAKKAA